MQCLLYLSKDELCSEKTNVRNDWNDRDDRDDALACTSPVVPCMHETHAMHS